MVAVWAVAWAGVSQRRLTHLPRQHLVEVIEVDIRWQAVSALIRNRFAHLTKDGVTTALALPAALNGATAPVVQMI